MFPITATQSVVCGFVPSHNKISIEIDNDGLETSRAIRHCHNMQGHHQRTSLVEQGAIDWMFVPPHHTHKIQMLKPNSQCDGIWR